MPIKTVDHGPGTLTLGALAVQAQMTNVRVETSEEVTTTDSIPVLSGEEKAGTDRVTHTHTIAGNMFQDLDAAGLVAYSFANAGQWVACTYTPNTTLGATIQGEACMVPVTVGGDVTGIPGRRGENLRSDFSWRLRPVEGDTVADLFTPGA